MNKPLECLVSWRHLGRFHVEVSRDLNQERSDNSVQLVIDFTSLNAAFKVDARGEQNAAELMEPVIHVAVLARGIPFYHHMQLIQATLTFTVKYKSTNSTPAATLHHRFTDVAFTCVGWQVTLCDPIWQVTPRSSETDSHEELYLALTFFNL